MMIVVVVGAGPVGCLISILLASKGHDVRLYETYGVRRNCKSRSINITLSKRGIAVLEKAVPVVYNILQLYGVKAYGRIVHDKAGRLKDPTLYGQNNEAIVSFKRNQLCEFLLEEVQRHKNIQIHFFHELVNVEPDTAKLTFRNTQNNELVCVDGDFIIGADGAHSAVRQSMQKNNILRHFEQKRHDHCYIEFHIPKNDKMDTSMLHMWPRHDFMMLALPNIDGSFCGNLFMVKEDMQRVMRDDKALLEFCNEHFRDVLDIIGKDGLVNDFQPCSSFSPYCLTSTKCAPYHAWNKVVIIGDAAHTVVPFYGQGMNAGFQDCQVLMQILDGHALNKGDLPKALQMFSETQCKNGHAVADLAFEHYNQLRSGIAGRRYYIHRSVDCLLNRFSPRYWPLEYHMIAFSQQSYSDCLQEKRRKEHFVRNIIYCLCLLIFLVVLFLCSKYSSWHPYIRF